jgi:predicted enzyme related to lactoylglutathione lyase
MPNNVSFFAINADDVPRARKFYEAVFGWTVRRDREDPPRGRRA